MNKSISQERVIIERNSDLIINENIKYNLLICAKWGRFLGVMSYIGSALMLFFGILFLFSIYLCIDLPVVSGVYFSVSMFLLMIIYGFSYSLIGKYLLSTSKLTKIGIETNNQEALEQGIKSLRKSFYILGIITISGVIITIAFLFISILSIKIAIPLLC